MWKDIRYFFYITNIKERSPGEVVYLCNDRCNQENLIEQLKNGLKAMRMPVGGVVANGISSVPQRNHEDACAHYQYRTSDYLSDSGL